MTDMPHAPGEHHLVHRTGWLRAAVLGANDGIISVSSLLAGVAASPVDKHGLILTGVASVLAGALSMAAGEYVSVSSQRDTEEADLRREKSELKAFPEAELEELTQIYVDRGLTEDLAKQVAHQLTAGNALEAHARDELGIVEHAQARPVQAAVTSAITFTVGALPPLVLAILSSRQDAVVAISAGALVLLAVLGAVGAVTGGAPVLKGVVRVTLWGALALAVTATVGHLFGVAA